MAARAQDVNVEITLVSDEHAPSFTVIADPEGNKACVCTWQSPAKK